MRGVLDKIFKRRQVPAAIPWKPARLFTTGVNGTWYDPSDFSTMFQDAAGTTPVTAVGQPVGLMLDKSKGLVLGPELVTNGGFSSNLSSWAQSTANYWTWVNGRAYHANSANYNELSQTFAVISMPVRIEFDYECLTDSNTAQWFYINAAGIVKSFDSAGIPRLQNGVGKMIYTAIDGIQKIGFSRYSQAEFYIDNISVRELPGNHAFNPSGNSANFPVLSARYNLLTKTEQFDDAIWGKQNVTIAADAISAPNGTITADALIPSNATNTFSGIYRTEFTSPQKTFSAYVKKGSKRWAMLLAYNGNNNCWFDLDNKVPGTRGANFSSSDITDIGNGWLRISATLSAALGGNTNIGLYCSDADNSMQCIGDGVTAGIYIWGADLRVANDALNQPAYQRVNTATDYDTVGFKPYLSFNGVNQWLRSIGSIDFTYGDKMFVSAGVRKIGVGTGVAIELSPNTNANNGAFGVYGPDIGNDFTFASKGTSVVNNNTGGIYPSPISSIITGIGDISAPANTLRINGSQQAKLTVSQGTGNYGNYPLYIGARAGSSFWFNGRLYGLVVAGKAASASEIASTEAWLNQKTGAY